MSILNVAFAAVAGFAAMSGISAGDAEAGFKHRHFHGFHHHNFYRRGIYLNVGPSYHDCGFYREMWEDTGLRRWKRRYYACKGWW